MNEESVAEAIAGIRDALATAKPHVINLARAFDRVRGFGRDCVTLAAALERLEAAVDEIEADAVLHFDQSWDGVDPLESDAFRRLMCSHSDHKAGVAPL